MLALPNDTELEKSIIGSCLVSDEAAVDAVKHLTHDDFYRSFYATIFKVIEETLANGEKIDPLVVSRLVPEDIRGVVLDSMCFSMPGSQLESQIQRCKDLSNARKIILTCQMVSAAASQMEEPEKALSNAVNELMSLSVMAERKEYSMLSLVDERLSKIDEPEEFLTVDGFDGLHLFPGDLFVLGGRPAAGKSAFAMHLALQWAKDFPVMFYSYEMTETQLANRIISSITGFSVEDVETGITQELVDTALAFVDDTFYDKNMTIKVAAGMTNAELFADMYRFAAAGGKVAIIDYLQLAADKNSRNLVQDVTLFSNKLRRVALDSGLLVVAVSQLNRESVERDAVRLPLMSDLRESGAIEQDATQICLLTSIPNPKVSTAGAKFINGNLPPTMLFSTDDLDAGTGDPDDDKVLVIADWVKVRQGKRRRWPFIFDGKCMRFDAVQRIPMKRVEYVPTDSKDAAESRLC